MTKRTKQSEIKTIRAKPETHEDTKEAHKHGCVTEGIDMVEGPWGSQKSHLHGSNNKGEKIGISLYLAKGN